MNTKSIGISVLNISIAFAMSFSAIAQESDKDLEEMTKEAIAKSADAIMETSSEAWDATKKGADKAWDATKEGSKKAADYTKDKYEDAREALDSDDEPGATVEDKSIE